jgi:hypothetical protein
VETTRGGKLAIALRAVSLIISAKSSCFIPGLCLFAALSVQSFGQSITSGDVTGSVTDPSGAVVPNAAITLMNVSTNAVQKSTTNAEGTYRFAFVTPGTYKISVNATGFQTQERPGLVVNPGQPTPVNIQLTVATASQTVDVVEGAAVLQTENADDTTSFSADMIQDLPNPGGDLTYVAQTVAGVVMATQAGYGNFEANGMPATSNLFTVNGGNANDVFLSLNNSGASNLSLGGNDMAEASVVNNAYSGQYGQYSGTQVAYITKSGSNQFHGDAIYMWNGRDLNANQFFSNEVGSPRPFNNFNQWATNVNGPIRKNKTFFDVDYEGLRNVLPTAANLTLIPSPQFQAATLLNLAADGNAAEIPFYKQIFAVYNGSSGSASATPVAGGGCSGLVSNFLSASAPCALQFRTTPPNENKENNWAIRVDHVFSENDRGYVRFWRDNGFQPSYTSPFGATFNAQSNQPQFTAQASESHTFGPNTVNQINATALFYAAVFVPSNPTAALAAMPTFLNFSDGSFTYIGSGSADGGFFDFPQGRRVFQAQVIDDISHVWGRHTFRGGFNYIHDNITDLAFQENTLGQVTTNLGDFFNGGGPNTSLNQYFPTAPEQGYKLGIFGAYVADDWKVTDRLTISLNLRFEHYNNPTCNASCFSRLASQFTGVPVNDSATPYNQLILSGQKNAYNSMEPVVYEPRIGVAWKPFAHDDKTVFRGGFGVFSDPITGGVAEYAALNAPGNVAFTVGNGNLAPGVPGSLFTQAAQSDQAFQSQFKSGGSLQSVSSTVAAFSPPSFTSFPNKFQNPLYYKWNFEVQRTIGTKTVLSANYSGMHGIRIPIQDAGLNAYCPASVCPNGFAGLPAAVPNPALGTILQYLSAGVANYNGLQLSAQQRIAAGLTFNVNYTWSHALDDISNGGQNEPFNDLSTDMSISYSSNPFNISKQYGNADYDVRNYFSAGVVLNDMVRHAGFKRGPNQVFGGWTLSSNIFWRSGMPFSVIDNSAAGALAGLNYIGTIFATPLQAISSSCGNAVNTPCLTPSQFAAPAAVNGPTGFGTIGRNTEFGPHFFNLDFSVMKGVRIKERATFQFGFQAYNALNHPNFDQPVNDISNPLFGSSIATVAPPTSLLGSFVGAGSSPRFVEIKGILRF